MISKNAFRSPDSGRKGPVNSCMSDCKYVRPSVRQSIIFFPHHMLISFFLKWNTYPQLKKRAKTFFFSEKFRFSLKCAKLVQKGSSIRFFEIFEKFIHCYLLDLLYNESSYYLLYFNANHSSGKILVPIMSQNTLSQLDCSVLKSAIYLGWIDELAWIFNCKIRKSKI